MATSRPEQDDLLRYWGKARSDSWHPLACHCLDAAAVADAWLRLDPPLLAQMARASASEETRLRPWLLFFCALHDLGKWDVRFQLKVPELARSLRPDIEAKPPKTYDHGQAGYAAFMREFAATFGDEARRWMQAAAGHHGIIPADAQWRDPWAAEGTIERDRRSRRLWFNFLFQEFLVPAGAGGIVPPPPAQLAGFCCVSDWLASNEEFFPFHPDIRSLDGYFADRAALAERCLRENGLVRRACERGGMAETFPALAPRGAQAQVEEWPLSPGLTLIEASTGSGKTEAALAYASRLLAAGQADGVIFALPTQATANAMLGRVEAWAARAFRDGTNVVLAHGRAKYNERFMALQKPPRPGAQGREDAAVQCSGWLASSRKKVFLGQVGVCTVDQALLSVLPLRHGFVRAFGLQKSVLIVDEVHAYDSYMNGLLDEVLQRQREAGGSAVLLSATLPASRRGKLMRLWSGVEADDHPAQPYPLVSRADAAGRRQWEPRDAEARRIVRLEPRPSPKLRIGDADLERLAQAARAGARAALVCNLVADAQDAARRLLARGVPADVFHSRFLLRDRQELETRILQDYGPAARPGEGRVLIATQVVEQSLDLDFDWMITQLCPADLLFQRLGRLHRHKRRRPAGYDEPRCAVVVATDLDLGGHRYVYENARALWRTQQLIETRRRAEFPGAYREWIEAVYAQAPWPDEPPEVERRFDEYETNQAASRLCARQLASGGIAPFNDTDGNVTALTRDGEMAVSVVLFVRSPQGRRFLDGSAFRPDDDEAADQNSVPVPRGWAKGLQERDESGRALLELEPAGEGEWDGMSGATRWRYSPRFGLEMTKS